MRAGGGGNEDQDALRMFFYYRHFRRDKRVVTKTVPKSVAGQIFLATAFFDGIFGRDF